MPDSRPRLHRIVSISRRRRTKGSQPSSSHPLHTISIRILLLLLLAFVLLMVGPASGQATCAFLGQLPQFAGLQLQPADLPKEPLLPTAANVLRICEPTGPSCCTARLEAQLEQLEKLQLEEGIRSQLRLVRRFLQKTATNFRDEFRMALHNSASLLRRLFRLTYGHFFVQHQRIFDNYFAELADLFTENGSGDFGEATQKLFRSIFVAEFALLNPMRLIDANAERCLLAQQLPLGPFGTVPTTVNNLLARTFRVWTSLIKAVDKAGSQLEALEKAFSLPQFCPPALVRMRHCHLCSPNPLPESRPCPNLCQNVLGGCLHQLARLGPAWELAIDTLLRLSADLHSVHDPHLALAPLPVQISEAIMHFQERGPLLSSRILFRCFGQEFQRMVGRSDEPKMIRRRRRRMEMEANGTEQLSEEDEENSDESNLVDAIQLELNDFHNVQSTRDMVEQFREGVLRLRGFWTGLSRIVCQEGGMQAAGPGDRCWNGTAMSRYRWRLAGPGLLAGNPEFRHLIRSVEDRFAQEREAIFALAESLATKNGWTLERPREQNVTEECERALAEEDGGRGMSPDDEDSMEASGDDSSDYEEEEERQQFWQRQKDVQRRRWNFGGGGGANAGASGRNGILFSWTLLSLIFFVYSIFFLFHIENLNQ